MQGWRSHLCRGGGATYAGVEEPLMQGVEEPLMQGWRSHLCRGGGATYAGGGGATYAGVEEPLMQGVEEPILSWERVRIVAPPTLRLSGRIIHLQPPL